MRLFLCCAIFALLATSAEAAKRSPDLVVSRVSAPSTVAPGASVKVGVTTKNTGKARGARSATTVKLAQGRARPHARQGAGRGQDGGGRDHA